MARKTMWAVAGALLAFAPLASAEWYIVDYNNERTYASEVISSGEVQIDYRGNAPEVVFEIRMSNPEVQMIDEDDTIDVTFTLSNARFGRNVRAGDMDPQINDVETGSCTGRVADVIDGERGESAVTFRIEAAEGDCTCGGGACSSVATVFTFELPRLYGLSAAPGRWVSASVSTDTPGGSGWPDTEGTPANAVNTGQDCTSDAAAMTACTSVENGVIRELTAPIAAIGGRRLPVSIIDFQTALQFAPTSGGSTDINLAAGRTSFVYPGHARLGSAEVGLVSTVAAACDMDPAPRGCYLQADGRRFSLGRGGEGRGDLVVNVSGDFRSGDTVFLDLNGDSMPSTGESLSLVDGSMEGAFNLIDVAGDASAGEDTVAREEGAASRNLLYRPNNSDPLRPGGYRSSFAVNFNGSASDKPAGPASTVGNTHNTDYTVVEDSQVAYAIPPGTTGDIGNVRIKCDVATSCTVYLECDHADGRSWFEQVVDPIPGRSTLVLTSEGMRTALGMDDDEWTRGRLSCTVHSTREISLQVLTRSDSGVLVNNTYVDD